ncbi:fungal-specific transcription factor domain-containing protein [Xylariales sp. PMI_506]|nr:fungal-specific transcription factor domain-containing protein [Xylariales sp. PMI_506]
MVYQGYIVFPGLSTIDNSVLSTVHEAFPPMNVAEFLVQVFFHTVEANSYFMDRERFSTRLEKLYDSTGQSPRISTDGSGDDVEVDPSFLCLSLLVFALGSQFAEMQIPDQSITPPPSLSRPPPGDDPGMVFYQKAKLLLPDMLTQCSLESMQACFLMGLFLLPSNVSDLSCVYHGMALKMAIAAGLHRKVSGHDLDARLIQVRNRLWWSLYVSDRRLAIVLDHPESIREEDIDAPLPESHPQLDVLPIGDNNLANLQADIALTKIFNNVVWVRKTVGFESTDAGSYIDAIKRSLTGWLDDLPWHLQLSNLDPDMQSFRGAVQLHMSYNLIIIHMGRKCLLNHIQQHLQGHYDQSNGSQTHPKARRHRGSDEIPMTPVHGPTDRPRYSSHSRNSPGRGTIGNDQLPQMNKMEKALIRDCVSAAFEIIKLVSYLSETGKLARCSFADLSCCGTAGIIIMIHDIIKHHPLYRSSMQTMLNAMEHMAAGCHKACNSLGLIQQLRTVITEVKRKMAAASAATQKKQGDTEDRNYEASHENPGLKIPTEVGYQDWRRWMAMRGADDSSASEIWTDQYAIQTPDHSLVGVTGHVNRNPPGSEIGASRPSAEVVRHAEQEFSDGDDVAAMGGPHLEFAPGYPGTEGQVQYNTYTWPANLSSLGLSGFEDLEFPVF